MSFIVAPLQALFTVGGPAAGAAAPAVSGIGTALKALSIGVGLFGAAKQAQGQRRAAEAEAEAAEFNARAQQQQAEAERDRAGAEAGDFRRRHRRILAERRASAGASGITQAGSPLLVEESMLREIALGSARVGHEGVQRASRLEDSATLSRMRGKNARKAGRIRAGATLLSGFGDAAYGAAQLWG